MLATWYSSSQDLQCLLIVQGEMFGESSFLIAWKLLFNAYSLHPHLSWLSTETSVHSHFRISLSEAFDTASAI